MLGVRVGERATRHQRRHHRDAGELGESAQLGGGACLEHAATDVQDRATGGTDELRRLPDLLGMRPSNRPVARQVQRGRPDVARQYRRRRLQDVLGQVDQDRPGTSRRSQVERLGDRARDVVRGVHQEVVLRDRQRDAADVGFLEGVRPDRRARHLAGDRHHGHRVHVGVRDRRNQVRRTRPGGRDAHTHPAGRLRVTLGGVPRPLLVANQDVAETLSVVQRVIQRQDRAAGNAEDHVGSGLLQRKHERLRSGDLSAHLIVFLDVPRG